MARLLFQSKFAAIGLCMAIITQGCSTSRPMTLNLYESEGLQDSEVALVRQVSAAITQINGTPLSKHPDDGVRYGDIRLPPGPHTLTVSHYSMPSVMVSWSAVDVGQSFTFDLDAGHIYEAHSERVTGTTYVYMWIEDTTTETVVAGNRIGGPQNKEYVEQNWPSSEKRIALFEPRFRLSEREDGQTQIREEWNQAAKSFAIAHLRDQLSARGITMIEDRSGKSLVRCHPDTETGIDVSCGDALLNDFNSDYGLFLVARDDYSRLTAEEIAIIGALTVFTMGLIAVPTLLPDETDTPDACLSLVSARSHLVVWRNCLDRTEDWRDETKNRKNIDSLLDDFPVQ